MTNLKIIRNNIAAEAAITLHERLTGVAGLIEVYDLPADAKRDLEAAFDTASESILDAFRKATDLEYKG